MTLHFSPLKLLISNLKLGKSEDVLGTIPTSDEMQAELDAIKEEADEALQQVVDEGIKDQMTSSEPPKELKEPE